MPDENDFVYINKLEFARKLKELITTLDMQVVIQEGEEGMITLTNLIQMVFDSCK